MSHFWWGDGDNKERMHWMVWWKMCVPKIKGGMGFRDMHCFNLAMLTKKAWHLIDNLDSLCATIFRFSISLMWNLLNATLKKGASFNWLYYGWCEHLQSMDTFWRVGDGKKKFGMTRGFLNAQQGEWSQPKVGTSCLRVGIQLILTWDSGMKIWSSKLLVGRTGKDPQHHLCHGIAWRILLLL